MAARKDDAPAISLFSFQDIITSLTGIMFLVVLLLILFMIDMRPKTAEDDASPESKKQQETVNETIEKDIENLRSQLRAYQERSETLHQRLEELRKLDLEHIQEKLSQLRVNHEEILVRKESMIRENAQITEAIREEQRQVKQIQKECGPIPAELAKLDQKIEKMEKNLNSCHAQTMQIKNAVKYTIENTSTLKPVLVECSRDGIRILDCSDGTTADLRKPGDTYTMQKVRFLRWLKDRNRSDEYYTILIKPGSFDYADLINALKNAGKERGLELLPEDDLTVFGGN